MLQGQSWIVSRETYNAEHIYYLRKRLSTPALNYIQFSFKSYHIYPIKPIMFIKILLLDKLVYLLLTE